MRLLRGGEFRIHLPVQKQARNTSDLKRKNDGPAAILSTWPQDLRNLQNKMTRRDIRMVRDISTTQDTG